ncbi:hypothetical protein LEP1GSC058_3191 [Leptospira fainei serovar Hurstbridge str. BUT 6]|uniref:Uncharacterized protein n=1 Tax=Leptospira fainei serovar Hurstbridge str. BUT 6 TaxID=1193011 RepID=S3VD92_9LEPT|nr:hypothetical protein [Leptospira fainei]EPG74455.1 hypothetical protein LEP1GSC058_3191 [Leptospira fainei serovar Hurstbridge str. BUT 6]
MNVFISEKKIGETSRWRSLSLSLALLFTLLALAGSPWDLLPEDSAKNTASIDKIWENIYSEDYISAKKLVQKELQNGKSDSLPLLSLLEICLNGLARPKQADETRKKILQLWEKNYKRSFVEENYPLNLATWTRMAVVTPNILVLGAEYYIPYPINPKKDGFYYHKFTAYNRFTKRATKFFKLEKSSNTENEYRLYEISSEGEAISVKNYGNSIPDLRDEMKDVIRHLKL